MKTKLALALLSLAAVAALAARSTSPVITGDYLETRSCDVYTGHCFANAEMGLTGKEAILVWSVRHGSWQGARLDGLNVIAVVRTDGTLGDQRYTPRSGRAVLVVDATASARQREALLSFARDRAAGLINEVVDVKTVPIEAKIGACNKSGCASVTAGDLVKISTRCFSEEDHVCGNEETFYPPLTETTTASPAFTELSAFHGRGLNATWESTGQRSAFLGTFAR